MFRNSQKISISKRLIIPLLFVVLIFTSVGVNMGDVCAQDLNESVDGIASELNIEDKLENSQENILNTNVESDESLSVDQDYEVLSEDITPENHTFESIQKAIDSANDGDTIKLSGTYEAQSELTPIKVNKKVIITADSMATLDAKGMTRIFTVTADDASFNNLKLYNAYNNGSGGGMYIYSKNVKVTNCIFEDCNTTHGSGIATVYNNYSAINLLVENCRFINNYAQRTGAGISAYGNNTRIINCTFESNKVYNGSTPMYGAAIQIGLDGYVSTGYIYGCKFYNNYVKPVAERAHGGAGCVRDGIVYENCLFVNNSAAQGGALTYHGSGMVKNCTFINNTAYYYGGALSNGFNYIAGDFKIEDCNFEGNDAPLGGAIQLLSQNIIIDGCNFTNNTASKNGGAININAETVSVENSNFYYNIANVDGGAVFINGKSTSIKGSSFKYNEAIPDVSKLDDGLGGAIYINSTRAFIENNEFYFNTARNGSAIYYDKYGSQLKLTRNTLYQNQAWVYALPIYANDIYYGETETLGSIIHGGNNIAKYGNLPVSNAIYNAANNDSIEIDGETPVLGATTSGHLYQDDREYNMNILLTVVHEDGTVVYNETLHSDNFGEVKANLNNLKCGKYNVTAKHDEDTYYKAITNTTSFVVMPILDIKVKKSVSLDKVDYNDTVVWTLDIENNGPCNATGVIVKDVLSNGLEWVEDNTNGKYNPQTGILRLNSLKVGEVYVVKITTRVKKTGTITNKMNVTANEHDYNLTNNYAQSKVIVNPAADLAVTKAANVTAVNLYDSVKWTVTVTNNGPDAATGVVVSDLLPKSLIWISDDSSGKYNHNTGKWDVGTLNKGKSAKLNIVCKVNATGSIRNQVSVTGNEFDWDKSNNDATKTIKSNPISDLGIVKSVSSPDVNYGDVVCWTLTVTNYGPIAATGININDTLPNGFVYLNSTLPYNNGVVNVGSLAVGGSVSVKIYTRANVTGSFVNVASVKGNEFDQNPANDKANVSLRVNPAADLQVKKASNASTLNLNDLVKWTVTVSNNGPDAATGVVVTDLLPESLIWVSDDSAGKYNHNTGKWNVGTLNKGKSVKLNIVCKVNATGSIKNVVSVSGNEFDWDKSNNNATKTVKVNPASDLGIVKSVSSATVNYGDAIYWTLTVTNHGPDVASGVKIQDTLPNGFVYLNSTLPYVNGVINVGNLEVGSSVSVKIYARANATGSFVNVASVKGNEFDQNSANDKANVSVRVNPAADLQVKKASNASSLNLNDLVKWTVTVSNNGPDAATGVVVTDSLPESLIWVSDDSAGKYNHNTGKWNIGKLNNGGSVRLNIVCKVNATGSIKNVVSVSGNQFDWDMSNNDATKTVKVNPASDLGIVKSVDASVVNYGDAVCWTLTVTNYGPDAATGVNIYDTLPKGFVYLNSTLPYSNGVINIGNLAAGSSVSVKIYSMANISGSFVNVASVKGNEFDQNSANDNANVSVRVNPAADLQVKKSANVSTLNLNDLVKWTVTVSNNGPDAATGVTVKDVLPKSLIWVSDDSAGKYNHNTGKWNVGKLNSGSSVRLNIVCKVNATGSIKNVVSVSANEFDLDMSNNDATKTVKVNPASDLGIVKSVDASVVNYGDAVCWTLTVTNYGPDAATGVNIYDTLPEGFVYMDSTMPYNNGVINVGNLAAGSSVSVKIYAMANVTGSFVNVASVNANEFDQNLSNNKGNISVIVNPAADLQVKKSANVSTLNLNDLVKWTVTVSNNGPDAATGVTVKDVLPKSLIWVSDDSAGKYNHNTGKWNVGKLNSGSSVRLNIVCKVNATGSIKNVVSVSANEFDLDMSNNDATKTVKVNPASDLGIVKSVDASVVNYGDAVCWTLTVTNYGPDVASGVKIYDTLPDGFVYLNSTLPYSNGVINLGNLEVGSTVSVKIYSRANVTGSIVNVAGVKGNEFDQNSANDNANISVRVNPAADLQVKKSANVSTLNLNDLVKWTVTVSNNGPDAATGVTVKDVLPKSLIWISDDSAGKYNHNTGKWNVGTLNKGKSVKLNIVCKVNATGSIKNVVSVSANEFDWDMSNNDATKTVKVNPAADLSVVKSVNASVVNYGDVVCWTVTVLNNGPDAATDVVVTDLLPKSLIWVSDDSSGRYNHNTGKWNVGTLNNGDIVKLNIVCKVNITGSIKNMVSVSGNEFDWDMSNNDATKSVKVNPASDLAIIKSVNAGVVNYGDVVCWTITVSNNGPDSATGVKIYDTLPEGFVYVNSTKPLTDGIINVGNLSVGSSVSVKIYSRVTVTGSFVNVAGVKANEFDQNTANNNANASIRVEPAADLQVTKSVDNTNPDFAEKIKWTISVVNKGPNTATGVIVNDILPKSLVWISDDSYGSYNHNTGVWNVGNIENGQNKTLTIITEVNGTGLFKNNVSVTGNEFDWDKSNNNDEESIEVSNVSDLSVVKVANHSEVQYHQLVKWTITAKNNGPSKVTGVLVEDILPEGLQLINYTASKGFYDNGLWSLCCLEKGESQTLELTCYVSKTGILTNIVKIDGDGYDCDLSNNEDNASVVVPKSSDISIVKNVNDSNPGFGDEIEWSITVSNNGPDDSGEIFVMDELPEGLEFVEYTCTSGSYDGGIWHIDHLNNGDSESIDIRCIVNTFGDIENVVNAVHSQYDWNESNNIGKASITVNHLADLAIEILVNVSSANCHDLVKWTLIAFNYGPGEATGVVVRDVIPNGLAVVDVYGDGIYEDSMWYIGDLDNGDSKQLDIVCKIEKTGDFTNAASIWGDETDPNLENNEDEDYLQVYPSSDISITKTVSKYKYAVGEVVTYLIKITNKGPDAAKNVRVNEIMDDSLELLSFRVSAGDFDKLNNVWSIDLLDAGRSAFLQIKAIATKAGSAENNVVATNDNYDPNLSNNNAAVTVDIVEKQVQSNASKISNQKHSAGEMRGHALSILEKYETGNPFMVFILLFVFTMGALYGNNILKKR